jgi:hypothetical protein
LQILRIQLKLRHFLGLFFPMKSGWYSWSDQVSLSSLLIPDWTFNYKNKYKGKAGSNKMKHQIRMKLKYQLNQQQYHLPSVMDGRFHFWCSLKEHELVIKRTWMRTLLNTHSIFYFCLKYFSFLSENIWSFFVRDILLLPNLKKIYSKDNYIIQSNVFVY